MKALRITSIEKNNDKPLENEKMKKIDGYKTVGFFIDDYGNINYKVVPIEPRNENNIYIIESFHVDKYGAIFYRYKPHNSYTPKITPPEELEKIKREKLCPQYFCEFRLNSGEDKCTFHKYDKECPHHPLEKLKRKMDENT